MSEKLKSALKQRWVAVRRIYWRPTYKVVYLISVAVGAVNLILGEYGSSKVQQVYRLGSLPLWCYPVAAMLILFVASVEGAVRELGVSDEQRKLELESALRDQREKFRDDVQLKTLEFQKRKEYEDNRPEIMAHLTWTEDNTHELTMWIKSDRPMARILLNVPAYEDIFFMSFLVELNGDGKPLLAHQNHFMRNIAISVASINKLTGIINASAKCVDMEGTTWEGVYCVIMYNIGSPQEEKQRHDRRFQKSLIKLGVLDKNPGDDDSGV